MKVAVAGKILLCFNIFRHQKRQNDILRGNMNMDASPKRKTKVCYILYLISFGDFGTQSNQLFIR